MADSLTVGFRYAIHTLPVCIGAQDEKVEGWRIFLAGEHTWARGRGIPPL